MLRPLSDSHTHYDPGKNAPVLPVLRTPYTKRKAYGAAVSYLEGQQVDRGRIVRAVQRHPRDTATVGLPLLFYSPRKRGMDAPNKDARSGRLQRECRRLQTPMRYIPARTAALPPKCLGRRSAKPGVPSEMGPLAMLLRAGR